MLIGLCGYPGSGKSELRDILVKDHGFVHVDTKVVIKKMANVLTGQPVSLFETQEGKSSIFNGHTNRKILGELGNAIEKLFGDDYILNESLSHYRDVYGYHANLIVDSLRKDQPRNFPGLVVQVISNRAKKPEDDFDRFYQGRTNNIIINDGDQEDLRETIRRILDLP